ncbi:protein Atossa isoform X2 [Ochlerotatus camptorhynchus]|uniref:protein Atossa isoform X2 n=1 Tax=Ochlerotatus camptorhynchus TaxID=644619 RepID=UPI0031D8BA04
MPLSSFNGLKGVQTQMLKMHSGSFISSKHPAIPVSIGIASIVLEGRPAILDEGSARSGDSTTAGGGPGGGGGGSSDEEGGFHRSLGGGGRHYNAAESSIESEGELLVNERQQHSFMSDAAKRINLKLQQIRTCPGSSKDVVENMITVEASSSSGMGRRDDERDRYGGYDGVETYVSETHPSESTSLLFSAKAWGREHIYSGFEKMKLLGAVSPIKVPPAAAAAIPFINFSSNVNRKKSDAGLGSASPAAGSSKQRTREGPHCEQFLKKIGVIKADPSDETEHSCSYRNEFCLRWQAYFKQLSSILTCGEAICIEVYLGPENHAILLEQWILKLKLKTSESTMTLQSLCAAIRSQLYFSQISAWTDLIKNSLEPEIFNNPRIRKLSADEPGASSMSAPIPIGGSCHASGETSPLVLPKAKLDILFRIRGYDNTACFNEQPNVHNFPDAIIADNYVIEVCLKSLPRLERIPSINDEMDAKMDESLVNDRMDLPCHEKGKHRCAFQDEDDEDPQTGEDDMSPAAISHREKQLMKYKKRMMKREKKKKTSAQEVTVANNGGGRAETVPMMVTPPMCKSPALKIPTVNHHASNCSSASPYASSINLIQPPLYSNCDDLYQPASCVNNTKATQTAIFLSMSNGGNVSTVATQTDASGCCCLCAKQQPEPAPGHRSTSTNSDSKMQYSNSNYNRRDYTSDDCDTSQPEVAVVVHDDVQLKRHHREEESRGLRKAELLLQAIHRTAIINDHQQPDVAHFKNNNYYSGSYYDNNNTGSDTAKCERRECDTFTFNKEALDLGDCRLCKRQKTKHNFKLALNQSDSSSCSSSSSSTNNSPPGCRRTLSESLVGHFTIPSSSPGGDDETDSNSYHVNGFNGHKQGQDVGDLSVALSSSAGAVDNGGAFSFEQLKKGYRRAFSEDVIDTISLDNALGTKKLSDVDNCEDGGDEDDEREDETFSKCDCPIMFAQPSPVELLGRRSAFARPNVNRMQTSTPASSTSKLPLYVSCTESDCSISTASSISPHKKQILSCTAVAGNSRLAGKPSSSSLNFTIPKINLTNVFNVSPLAREDSGFVSSSSPIPIDGSVFNFPDSVSRLNVQKSNSAPTCQLSPGSLSPRFLRHAYKSQRTRYLSERSSFSERSSIGSDEQFSDEEYPYLLDFTNNASNGSNLHLSPSKLPSSPLKLGIAQRPFSKPFSKNLFKFGRLPLLGTLEESLLQRRIAPKFQVADFKVLLGASGSFCPTQLTIPAASYFYELPGQHLTTPYVCELRLPRKGYSIPRQGTVQVTLLNPLGTVVRMFVVPYDFRDMPAMSTTFIRQRILAYDDSNKDASPTAGNRSVEQLSNAEQMKLLRYAIHLRFQTSRSGKLSLHTDIRLLISRRTDCDTAAAHAKNLLEAPNELKVVTIVPENPKFSLRVDKQ